MEDVDIQKELVSNKISLVKETTSTLLLTCIMVIKLKHQYKKTRQALMYKVMMDKLNGCVF